MRSVGQLPKPTDIRYGETIRTERYYEANGRAKSFLDVLVGWKRLDGRTSAFTAHSKNKITLKEKQPVPPVLVPDLPALG